MGKLSKNTLLIKIVTHYGRVTVYPVCKTAQVFASIAGTKTLTNRALNHIESLGYELQVQAPALNLKTPPIKDIGGASEETTKKKNFDS